MHIATHRTVLYAKLKEEVTGRPISGATWWRKKGVEGNIGAGGHHRGNG